MSDQQVHAHVKQAARVRWRQTGNLDEAITAAVVVERRMILDVVDAMADRADCDHQRTLLNRILEIYGRAPVDGPTVQTPDHCTMGG